MKNKLMTAFLLSLALLQGAFSAGVATGVVGGDEGGSSSNRSRSARLSTSEFTVVNGASSVQFEVYDLAREPRLLYQPDGGFGGGNGFLVVVAAFCGHLHRVGGQRWGERQQVMLVHRLPQPDASWLCGRAAAGWNWKAPARTFGFVAQVQRNGSLRGSSRYQDHGWRPQPGSLS